MNNPQCAAYLDTLGSVIHDSAGAPVRCPNDAILSYTYRRHTDGSILPIDLCVLHDSIKNRSAIFVALDGMIASFQRVDGGPIIVNNDWEMGYAVYLSAGR
jgi:hypothetical protein